MQIRWYIKVQCSLKLAINFLNESVTFKSRGRLFHSFAPLYPRDCFRYSVFGFRRVRSVQLFRKLYEV